MRPCVRRDDMFGEHGQPAEAVTEADSQLRSPATSGALCFPAPCRTEADSAFRLRPAVGPAAGRWSYPKVQVRVRHMSMRDLQSLLALVVGMLLVLAAA